MPWGGSAALRWICVTVLSVALLLTLPRQAPREARFERLLEQVRAGHVTSVQSPEGFASTTVVWHEGPLRWYRASGPHDALLQLEQTATGPGGHGLSFSTPGRDRLWIQDLSDSDEPSWLGFAAGSLWVLTFFVMLVTREHSYANRWAWFWLFAVGGVGPILMLFKEPEPLRLLPRRARRASPFRRTATRLDPITGGTGLAYAVIWAIGLSLAARGLSALAALTS
ncbi:MAG: hypothetical protein HOV83_13855 [Catenulispora sp.]|nr:hypothetical protein [Catenulispora sp.]